jgi:DNA-directed RNA polymerase subunit RPC12/RpoP
MEERREVKTFEIDYKCPKCGIGYLRPIGIIVDNSPLTYPHKCNNCDYKEIIKGHKYPYLVYEPLFDGIQIQHGNTIDIIHRDCYCHDEIHVGDINVKELQKKESDK